MISMSMPEEIWKTYRNLITIFLWQYVFKETFISFVLTLNPGEDGWFHFNHFLVENGSRTVVQYHLRQSLTRRKAVSMSWNWLRSMRQVMKADTTLIHTYDYHIEYHSFNFYQNSSKMKLWKDTIQILQSDNTFKDQHIEDWISTSVMSGWLQEIKKLSGKKDGKREVIGCAH